MIRTFIGKPLLLAALLLGGLYYAYGEVDPCRVLAVERARRAAAANELPVKQGLERWARLETSQMTTGACVSGLLDSWGARLSE